jgi:hypothetical protein
VLGADARRERGEVVTWSYAGCTIGRLIAELGVRVSEGLLNSVRRLAQGWGNLSTEPSPPIRPTPILVMRSHEADRTRGGPETWNDDLV